MSVYRFDLGKSGQCRVWLGAAPSFTSACQECLERLAPGSKETRTQLGAIEIFVLAGAKSLYGLIGGELHPTEDNNCILKLGVSEIPGLPFVDNIATEGEEILTGFPSAYSPGVFAGFDRAALADSLPAGTLKLNRAMTSNISSAEVVFNDLTFALITLFVNCSSDESLSHVKYNVENSLDAMRRKVLP